MYYICIICVFCVSDRKMMSVLVRYSDSTPTDGEVKSRLFLLVKGADSSVLKCCLPATPHLPLCAAHIGSFANCGLRTLVAAVKVVSEQEAAAWLLQFASAGHCLQNRGEKLCEAAKSMESGLTLLGAVGIEDELQEGVGDAITMLHSSGVNVWMITGDKAETALAIGKKCNLINLQKQELERMANLIFFLE
mmetsp:Transcript_28793/g.63910  ORF Transcript_28793/g.63910 Transcript_28793/m.63910 type:complete len:192 (-) Transcript_28793:267-842(-)